MDVIKTKKIAYGNLRFEFYLLKCEGIFLFSGYISENNNVTESCTTPGITDDEKTANLIFDTFVKYKVSPSHFYYIIDEIIK
jgi:hypothetical protein